MCEPTRRVRVLAYRGHGLASAAIRWQTRSPYAHVALRFGDTILEAWPGVGVRQRDVEPGDSEADVFFRDVPEHVYARMLEWALSHVGDRYDRRGVLRFISRRQCEADDDWFCSEFAFADFLAGGIRLQERMRAWQASPLLIVISPLLEQETE